MLVFAQLFGDFEIQCVGLECLWMENCQILVERCVVVCLGKFLGQKSRKIAFPFNATLVEIGDNKCRRTVSEITVGASAAQAILADLRVLTAKCSAGGDGTWVGENALGVGALHGEFARNTGKLEAGYKLQVHVGVDNKKIYMEHINI